MNDIDKLIEKAKKDRDQAAKALDNAEYFLSTLLKSIGKDSYDYEISVSSTTITEKPKSKFADKDQINLEELGVVGPPAVSFITHVENVVKKFSDQEFLVSHVEAILKDMGEMPSGKSPKAKISLMLSKLVKKGVIVKTFNGSGNIPNRYILKEHYKDPDETKPKTDNVLGLSNSSNS